jgi:hypothetical protein
MNQENEIAPSLTEIQVKSISDRKRIANRQNARRSTGPRTEAGKGRSRWNAIKHGLLLKVPANHWPYVTDGPEPFQELVKSLIVHFAPVGPIEGMLVEHIAQCYWRQHRFQRAENATIRLALINESLLEARGDKVFKTEEGADTQAIYEKARQSIDTLGYVEADLQGLVLEKLFLDDCREKFVAANKKALELVRSEESSQCSPELKIQMKRARSKLLRKLEECEDQALARDRRLNNIQQENRKARFEQHLALPGSMDTFLRYETANQRQLYRALEELERIQLSRRGDLVAPTRRLGT